MDAIEAVIADLAFERKVRQMWAIKQQAQAAGTPCLAPEEQHPWSPRHPRSRLRYRPGMVCIDCHAKPPTWKRRCQRCGYQHWMKARAARSQGASDAIAIQRSL